MRVYLSVARASLAANQIAPRPCVETECIARASTGNLLIEAFTSSGLAAFFPARLIIAVCILPPFTCSTQKHDFHAPRKNTLAGREGVVKNDTGLLRLRWKVKVPSVLCLVFLANE